YIIAKTPTYYTGNITSQVGVIIVFLKPKNLSRKIERAAYMYGVQPVYLSIPLPASMSVVLYKRLPLLVESQCQQMFLIHQDSYSIQFQDYTPY
ncbi:hypothetical protein GCK32_017364, partial [Trichostrongylus colubriformis]